MSSKITADHLARAAIVYVRQSTIAQVVGNLESQRRQYDLAGAARTAGFKSVTVIDDDLGRRDRERSNAPASSGWWRWCARATSARSIASKPRDWRATDGTGII
jgi:hypothetical protein